MAYGKKTGGGSRKGKRNKSTQEVKEILSANVDFNKVVEKLFELSQGVELEKTTASGAVIYSEKPDPFASKILLEYMFGKPLQKIDQNTIISQPQTFKIGDQEISFE